MGHLRRFLVLVALAVLTALAAASPGTPAFADDSLELRLRSGSAFTGRIVGSDDAVLRFKGTDGAEVRLAWKDLDERSWLTAKRIVTPSGDARALLALGQFAAAKGFRLDAEALLASVRRLDASLAPEIDALSPRIGELRHADALVLYDKGQAEVRKERFLHALGRFREARDLAPRDAKIVNALGEACYYLRRLKECRTFVEEALSIDGSQKDALFNLAQLDLMELDFAASLRGFEKVVALPLEPGKLGTREDVLKKAREEKIANPQEAFEKYADLTAVQSANLVPMLRGIVEGPKFATEYRSVTEHYDVRSDVSQEFADTIASRLELIYAEYDRRYGYAKTGEAKTRGKSARFPVIVFSDKKGYVDWFGRVLQDPKFGAMTGGVYVSLVKHLVFFQNPDFADTQLVAWHEGFHQYLDYYVASAPHWFNEGSAEYFGASALPPGKKRVDVGQSHRMRIAPLAQLVAQKRIPRAEWFMQTSARTFMRLQPEPGSNGSTTVGDHYALGWALVHFLYEGEGGKWKSKYTEFFKTLCDGVTHEEAFEKVWGKVNWGRFQAAFEAHCAWLCSRAAAEADGKPVPPMPK